MPLPLFFIGVAVASGGLGISKSTKAVLDSSKANKINKNANEIVNSSTEYLNKQREECGNSLTKLGEEKLFVLNHSISDFLSTFQKIKNVNFKDSEGLDELSKMHIDQNTFTELKSMVNFAESMAGGAVAGTAGGALIAFGAYGAAQALAFASTGTAISALSGAAATNATLAFFGGGSIAAGGLGMTGGTAVLGGLIAGPALMVVGFAAEHAAKKKLETACTNRDEAIQIAADLEKASLECSAIRRRTYMFYSLLARLDSYFFQFIYKMEEIVAREGDDYRYYSDDSKKVIASCASMAVTIKTVLDTPILNDEGILTDVSDNNVKQVEQFVQKLRINF